MATRRSSWLPLSLDFPTDSDEPAPPHPGDHHHALQDDRPRPDRTAPGTARAAPPEPDDAASDGPARHRVEGEPRGVEGTAPPVAAGQQPDSDRQRSAGDRGQGTGGAAGFRLAPERKRDIFARRGDDPYTPSHRERVRASRGQSQLPMFDAPPRPTPPAAPVVASSEKTKARDILAAIRTLQA